MTTRHNSLIWKFEISNTAHMYEKATWELTTISYFLFHFYLFLHVFLNTFLASSYWHISAPSVLCLHVPFAVLPFLNLQYFWLPFALLPSLNRLSAPSVLWLPIAVLPSLDRLSTPSVLWLPIAVLEHLSCRLYSGSNACTSSKVRHWLNSCLK